MRNPGNFLAFLLLMLLLPTPFHPAFHLLSISLSSPYLPISYLLWSSPAWVGWSVSVSVGGTSSPQRRIISLIYPWMNFISLTMSTIGHSFTSPSLGQYTSCNTVPIRWHPTPITGDFEASYPVFIQDTKEIKISSDGKWRPYQWRTLSSSLWQSIGGGGLNDILCVCNILCSP